MDDAVYGGYRVESIGKKHPKSKDLGPLGDFLEIETIKNQTDDETVKKIKKLQEQIFTKCDISLDQIEERFYRDLLAEIKN